MRVEITDVTARDGLQSEPNHVRARDKIDLLQRLAIAGAKRLEVTSFVSPRAVPQLADAEEVLAGLSLPDDVLLRALVPNLRGAERALQTRVDEWVCFLSATESHSQANSNCSVETALQRLEPVVGLAQQSGRKAGAALAVAFGCPFEGVTPVEKLLSLARELHAMGFEELTLGDTIGTATPSHVTAVVRAISQNLPTLDLVLHLHDTRGLSLANVMAGMSVGVDRFESSLGGVGGCPFAPGATGNVATEDLVHFLHAEGHQTSFDLDALIAEGKWFSTILGRELPAKLLKVPPIGFTVPMSRSKRAIG